MNKLFLGFVAEAVLILSIFLLFTTNMWALGLQVALVASGLAVCLIVIDWAKVETKKVKK